MDPRTSNRVRARINAEYQRHEQQAPPPDGFQPLPDVPASRYLDQAFFDLEQKHLWRKSWLLAAHTDELPAVGDYVLWDRCGEPVVLVRGRNHEIRAFYNTCMHRGGPLVRQACGNERVFVCKYHCWAYGLDGELNHVPDEHDFVAIDRSQRRLKALRCETFGNWVFVNRDPDAMPLRDFLGDMVEEWRDYEPDRLRFVTRYTYDLAVNWKISMDAFQEVYHIKHIHPQTVNETLDHRGATMALFANGHSRMVVPMRSGRTEYLARPPADDFDADPRMEVVRSSSVAYSMLPNIVAPTAPTAFPFLVFWPLALNRTLMEVTFYTRGENADPSSAHWQERLAGFNVILEEDNENLPWIQRSIESGALAGIPLSYQERRIYHFHEYLDQVIGADNIPPALRVAPRLRAFEEAGAG